MRVSRLFFFFFRLLCCDRRPLTSGAAGRHLQGPHRAPAEEPRRVLADHELDQLDGGAAGGVEEGARMICCCRGVMCEVRFVSQPIKTSKGKLGYLRQIFRAAEWCAVLTACMRNSQPYSPKVRTPPIRRGLYCSGTLVVAQQSATCVGWNPYSSETWPAVISSRRCEYST